MREVEELDNIEEIEEEDEYIEKPKKVKKRRLKKKVLFQFIFCLLSIIFIIGCMVYYGLRFYKYYKEFNPGGTANDQTILARYIGSHSDLVYETEGLYMQGGTFLYKGKDVNNYVRYSGLTWRIVKMNADNSIDLVLDKEINQLKWNKEVVDFKDSDISKYLNTEFIKLLDKDYLIKTAVCTDVISDINDISCDKTNIDNYVRLLDISEYLNSKLQETYVGSDKNIWLTTRGKDSIWNINNDSVSYSDVTSGYLVKPVVTIKGSTKYSKGSGTLEDPYVIGKEKDVTLGQYVKLGKNTWTIFSISKDEIGLTLTDIYTTFRFDVEETKFSVDKKYSVGELLNNKFLNSLDYKDMILEKEWYIGEYKDSYNDIYDEKVTAKVGLLNVVDYKMDDSRDFYLINGNGEKVLLYSDVLRESKPQLSRNIKPAIYIKNTKFSTGDGSLEKPFELEA